MAWADVEQCHGEVVLIAREDAAVLPPRDRHVLTDTIGGNGRAFCVPRFDGVTTVNMGPDSFDDPRRHKVGRVRSNGHVIAYGEVFVHELVHAWQIHHAPDQVLLLDALASKVCEMTGASPYDYGPAGPPYSDFNLEQQAQIVNDWFARYHDDAGDQPGVLDVPAAVNDPYFRYVSQVRGGIR